jgi:hypothetical protein
VTNIRFHILRIHRHLPIFVSCFSLFFCSFVLLFVCSSFYLSIFLSFHLFILSFFFCPSFHLFIFSSFHLFIFSSLCPSPTIKSHQLSFSSRPDGFQYLVASNYTDRYMDGLDRRSDLWYSISDVKVTKNDSSIS